VNHTLLSANAILLVGHPNVGKSVLFHRLTGAYVNVSNYPGTTGEVTGASTRFDREAILLDTPGVLALPSRSDDERATMRALLGEDTRCLVQVGDAKNLRRTLTLTALLAELGLPMVLALNMHDEAAARGVTVDIEALAEELGMPVLATVATFFYPGMHNLGLIALALAIAVSAAWISGKKVAMTDMPQMVALFNGMGGGSAAAVGAV